MEVLFSAVLFCGGFDQWEFFHSGRRMRLPSLSFPVATGTLRGSSATKKRAEVNIELIWSL